MKRLTKESRKPTTLLFLMFGLLLTGLLSSGLARAEGGFCPPGTIDHNNGRAAAIVCSPIPGYGNQQAPRPPPPPPQWVTEESRRRAEALQFSIEKRKKEIARLSKELNLTANDKCLTFVFGDKKQAYSGYGRTQAEAEQKQMARCAANGDTNCHVDTSFPCH